MDNINSLKITKNILNKYNLKANKRFGQNFLIDDNVLSGILNVANINRDELVIEIGPGLGNLTEYLLMKSTHCILIEIDNNMLDVLNDRFCNKYTNYTLINQDILKLNIDEMISKEEEKLNIKFKKVKVVANLPYYITSPIIFKLLQDSQRIDEIVVMVQKEVADRIVANSKSKDYGILTLMIDYYTKANIEIIVPNTSFVPSPDVTSAVIKLVKRNKYHVKNEDKLFKLIHLSFAQRRKKMINSLVSNKFNEMRKDELEQVFKACNIDLNVRAEELNMDKYIEIINYIESEENIV